MNNFTKTLEIITESSYSWKKELTTMDANSWGLYDKKTSSKAAKDLSKTLIKLLTDGFKELSIGNESIENIAKKVYSSFDKFRSKYYKEGAEDTVVSDIAKRIISKAFNVKAEIL